MKLYIVVLDEFPDYMTPTLVAHAVLGAHLKFEEDQVYQNWLSSSFKKVVLKVNQKEFDKVSNLSQVYIGHEKRTLDGKDSCIVVRPYVEDKDIPNVLRYAKMWKPKV